MVLKWVTSTFGVLGQAPLRRGRGMVRSWFFAWKRCLVRTSRFWSTTQQCTCGEDLQHRREMLCTRFYCTHLRPERGVGLEEMQQSIHVDMQVRS